MAVAEVHGQNPHLPKSLERHRICYVMAVPRIERFSLPRGPATAVELAVLAPAWQRCSAGNGAKSQHFHDWALIDVEATPDRHQWLLMHPQLQQRWSGVLPVLCTPHTVPLQRLEAVAGHRRAVEEGGNKAFEGNPRFSENPNSVQIALDLYRRYS